MTSGPPSVSVVVVNFNGRHHLADCFDSLAALEYPKDRLEVVCVENGSSDGSAEYVAEAFPWVTLVPAGRNLGFAGGSNLGAERGTGELVAFLNNDMKVHPRWLDELVAALDRESGLVCAAGRILNWEGDELDFVRGALNFHGNASQTGSGFPSDWFPAAPEDLLFPCGGSMIIDRRLFLEVGGFDEEFFAYFEDVDLGWRLWILGYQVRTAPGALVYHRGHATADALTAANREHLMEQNALAMLVKNVGDRHLGTLLSASLMLLVRRSSLAAGIKPEHYSPGDPLLTGTTEVDQRALAILSAANDMIGLLPSLLRKRGWIQQRRQRSDEEVFALFARPFKPQGRIDSYLQSQARIVGWLGIEELFPERETGMVLVAGATAPEHEAAWARRAAVYAQALAASWEVTFAGPPLIRQERVRTVDCSGGRARLSRLLDSHEVVVLHAGHLQGNPVPEGHILVIDLAGVDLQARPGWLRRAAEAGDAFVVPDADAAAAWARLLGEWGRSDVPPVVRVPADPTPPDLSGIVDLCRSTGTLWAARSRRRLARYTEEIEVLLSDRDKMIVDLESRQSSPLRAWAGRTLPDPLKRGIRKVLGVLGGSG